MALVAALGIAAASLALAYMTRGAPRKAGAAAAAQVQKLLTGGTATPAAKQAAGAP
jgi:hypothetical protein